MVYKRRQGYRKKKFNKRKYKRGMRMTRARIGNVQQKVFYYSRLCLRPPLVSGVDGFDSLTSYSFKLSDIPAVNEFRSLYDFFKLNAVKLTFLPAVTQSVYTQSIQTEGTGGTDVTFVNNTNTMSQLRIFSVVDYNDSSVPTTINELREYRNCKVSRYTSGHKRFFRVRNRMVSNNNNIIQYGRGNPWVSSEAGAIDEEYYGLKVGVDTSGLNPSVTSSGAILLKVEAKYYFSCKSVK